MILCYALGGGLGHITRIRALLHTLGREAEPVTVMVSSPLALDPRALGAWSPLLVPPAAAASPPALGDWVADAVARLQPAAIYVDAFPGGVLGDLCARDWPSGVPLFHAARGLRWQAYRRRLTGSLPPYDRVFLLEPLEAEHRAALAAGGADLRELALEDPPARASVLARSVVPGAAAGPRASNPPAWLVVHSGPAAEIHELLAYAADLRRQLGSAAPLTLIAPSPPADLPAEISHRDLYPAWPLFPAAPRIVTACGFNAMRQTAPHQDRHHFLPFDRSLDDQFARAARRRAGNPSSPMSQATRTPD